ncbi:hypothetical protein COCON_G00084400 [Conger conger]|uniref:NACHT LRR and PYD domain-containing protein n=1 Tax=Conger conger TaxID=82655 RepID=A0A9Q1DQ86_CONCO|nr:hypothetical protein COCON_G00084400 [Conger conger]
MSLRGDLQERLPDAEMNWSAEEEEEEEEEEEGWGPERNIFLLRGETSAGAAAGLKRPRDNRPPSPAPSYDSMTSDVQSDELRFDDDFSDGNEEPLPTGPSLQLERPDSSASSCCSMASDVSTESFSVGPRPRTKELDKEEVKALLGVSAEERHPAMSSAFMSQALQATLAKLKEGYLRYFKSCLVERYPQIFTSSVQEFEIPGLVDKMLERCDIEGSLKISLLILEDIELQYDANSLRGMCKRHEMQYDLKASLKEKYSLIFEGAVDRALQCANGHFHMFLRFLLGMSLGSNVERLEGIVTKVGGGTHLEKTAQYIKSKLRENHSEEKLKHLRRCLTDILPLHSTA